MGQDAYRKFKEFKQEERRSKKWGGSYVKEDRIKKHQWKHQEKEDNEDFERGYNLLIRNEY